MRTATLFVYHGEPLDKEGLTKIRATKTGLMSLWLSDSPDDPKGIQLGDINKDLAILETVRTLFGQAGAISAIGSNNTFKPIDEPDDTPRWHLYQVSNEDGSVDEYVLIADS